MSSRPEQGDQRPRCALLDVNVLVALAWPNHVHHRQARDWFGRYHQDGWATTPITEGGFVRVSSNRTAVATSTTPAVAISLLTEMTALEGHQFWPDDVALVVGSQGDAGRVQSHRRVTDAHLLALAARHGGRLLTFDAGLNRLLGEHDPAVLTVLR